MGFYIFRKCNCNKECSFKDDILYAHSNNLDKYYYIASGEPFKNCEECKSTFKKFDGTIEDISILLEKQLIEYIKEN